VKNRRDTGLIGRARRVLVIAVPAVGLALAVVGVVPARQALAQESSGGSIDIGGSIVATVTDAVSSVATGSGSTTTIGGISFEQNEIEFGDDESTAIADSSGGSHNESEKSGSRHDK
jgi:hypothetical protein